MRFNISLELRNLPFLEFDEKHAGADVTLSYRRNGMTNEWSVSASRDRKTMTRAILQSDLQFRIRSTS